MATEEKQKIEDEKNDLNFIKENELEEQNSKSSIKKSKEENSLVSNKSKDQKEDNENSKDEKLSQKSSKKDDSINLFKNNISGSKNNSSSKVNQRYSSNNNENKKEKDKDKKEFVSTGKFMQINPHFNIFTKQIDSLRDSIYDDTKRCLILKGSLQESSNFLKEESNGLIKDIVEQIYNLR